MAGLKNHVIETRSNTAFRDLLEPDRFVVREQSERDYGIDLLVECFSQGRQPTGRQLLVQLKGQDCDPPTNGEPIGFPARTAYLKHSELFAVPVLVVWVPVLASPYMAWYLWIQEYIEVVLEQDPDHGGWRDQEYKTLKIPENNALHADDATQRLQDIGAVPKRERTLFHLSGIAYEAMWHRDDPDRVRLLLETALGLPELGDNEWSLGATIRSAVREALEALDAPTDAEHPALAVMSAFASMNAAASQARDARFRYGMFVHEGMHRF